MASTIGTLGEFADQVLAVAAASLEHTDAGVPPRVYVSPTDPPTFDCCPFLAVSVTSLRERDTEPLTSGGDQKRNTVGAVNMVTYSVWAVRCAVPWEPPVAPSVGELAASANEVLQDGWALWNGMRSAIRQGDIFTLCQGARLIGGDPVEEQGGCVGWVFTLEAMIEGIRPFVVNV